MKHQPNLFDDDPLVNNPNSAANRRALALSQLNINGKTLSPEQKRFNKLLLQSEKLTQKIDTLRNLADAHRLEFFNVVEPLLKQIQNVEREMVQFLAERLTRKGLTRQQKHIACEILCSLAAPFALQGDAEMRALHDAHSNETLAEQQQIAAEEARALMEEMLGKPIDGEGEFSNPEDLLRAGIEQMRQQQEAALKAHLSRQEKRQKARKTAKPEQQQEDAEGALRAIYRQLVSALHPDRESDPVERKRKTDLMSEVNSAYEKRNLLALLELQLRAELGDGQHIATLTKEKVGALNTLLNERVIVLQHELYGLEDQLREQFSVPREISLSVAGLKRNLLEYEIELQSDITKIAADLIRVQTDKEFKLWLREQHDMAYKQNDDMWLDDMPDIHFRF
ncbi:MAG: hypothetical protein JNM52_01195 [Betaproteobacteria bacterium]|nr:hypothetical protein [Betaproteobacteria bacterium]